MEVLDSDEEVLVDDFDGQCCRTYPLNHSRIQRWRETRAQKERDKKKKEDEARAEKEKKDREREATKRLSAAQNLRVPPIQPEKSAEPGKTSETPGTTTGESIGLFKNC